MAKAYYRLLEDPRMKNPYEILGVARNASATDIKKAYRKLARELHPDSSPNNPKAEDRFKDLSTAYDIISDEDRRGRYDRGEIDAVGNTVSQRRRQHSGGYNQQDRGYSPFEDFFKRQGTRRNASLKIDGSDVSYSLKVDFIDVALGANKTVSMTNGKRLAVSIPAGTKNAQVLRLKGQGMDGIGGGKNGDAHVEILYQTDKLFRRDGDDLHVELPVSLPEALLGTIVEVPTIHGPVKLNVKAGSNTGNILRLKGKGIQNKDKKTKGNQFVTLKVVLPKAHDKQLIDFVTKWANKNDYDVRGVGLKPNSDGSSKKARAD
jgi:DnaJ-class molecular chaperone